jgi:hypothetical protein
MTWGVEESHLHLPVRARYSAHTFMVLLVWILAETRSTVLEGLCGGDRKQSLLWFRWHIRVTSLRHFVQLLKWRSDVHTIKAFYNSSCLLMSLVSGRGLRSLWQVGLAHGARLLGVKSCSDPSQPKGVVNCRHLFASVSCL